MHAVELPMYVVLLPTKIWQLLVIGGNEARPHYLQ